MPEGKQLLSYLMRKDLLQRVDDFRFENRFASRAEALNWLVEWALEQNPKPERPRRQEAAAGAVAREDAR